MLDIAIEGCGDAAQAALFLREAGGDGAFGRDRMFARGEFPAALGQPLVQRLEVGKAGQRREQPFADIADLVLDLTLLPTRGRGASDRLEDIVVGEHHVSCD